jgi:hypothetical protein
MVLSDPANVHADSFGTRDLRNANLYLRGLVRSLAAGELSADEYRRKRRAFIESACAPSAPPGDDLTVPRSTLGERPRRGDAPRPGRWRRTGWRWLLGMPLTVALLVTLTADFPL